MFCLPESSHILCITHRGVKAPAPRHVHVEPHPTPLPDFFGGARPGEESPVVMAMDGNVENARVGVEQRLGPVAVMDVPVDQ